MTQEEAILNILRPQPMGEAGPHDPRWFGNSGSYGTMFDAGDRAIQQERETGKMPRLNILPIHAPNSTIEDLLRGSEPPTHNFLPPYAPAHPINQPNLGGMLGAKPPTQLAGDVVPLPIAPGPMAGPPSQSGAPSTLDAYRLIQSNHPAAMDVTALPMTAMEAYLRRLRQR